MNSYKPEGTLISSNKNLEYISSYEGLEKALEDGAILEAPVVLADHELNLHVELCSNVRGIIPHNEVLHVRDNEKIKDIAVLTRVGKIVCFKIIGFEKHENGKCIAILSRRAAQRECIDNFISQLIPGDIIPTKVTHLENFGAFVDIGCGIISLLSIDSISVSRISHPSARLSVGDKLNAVVKSVDEKGRIFVSIRELLGTWEENASEFAEGQTVRGIVRSVENYGIFVELKPNLAGLAEFRDNVYVGQSAAVYIKSIIPEKMKIKLIIIGVDDIPVYNDPLEYYIDTTRISHVNSWTYSPLSSDRIIETVF